MESVFTMKGRYKASDVAKWFINEIHPEPLKLQKLLYLAQGYSYAFYDEPLFIEDMEAWVHGPVVASVYHEYRDFSYNPISTTYEVIQFDDNALEEMTHHQEPWILGRTGLDPDERSDKTISKQNIANYFISDMFQPEDEEWD